MTVSKDKWFEIWEGNRRLTVRTIEAFPEDKLFEYVPIEPLRPFSAMVKEILNIEGGYMRGIALNEWEFSDPLADISTKEALLKACEEGRAETRKMWGSVTDDRLATVEKDPFFGAEQAHFERLQYALENEIHHRGQGFVYLRMLGIEPPAFYVR